MSFAKKFEFKYGKNFLNKGILVSKRLKTIATKFNQSNYGKMLKKEGLKVGKLAGKQLSEKNYPCCS